MVRTQDLKAAHLMHSSGGLTRKQMKPNPGPLQESEVNLHSQLSVWFVGALCGGCSRHPLFRMLRPLPCFLLFPIAGISHSISLTFLNTVHPSTSSDDSGSKQQPNKTELGKKELCQENRVPAGTRRTCVPVSP